ncbi:MAG: hypothetical protein COZ34_01325 [Candidatus Pacebacteria bacterium CG_4_10_14_3_um_filter_34_15]|nr:HD domain-containing protein [Candidatus Paceibacterota bacterium]NCS86401.1 HD domain-containing protein [Candidatus Paceibacterota bacterium]PIX81900.1 MAG: hypothetical protein COZ34_01325 [Candidatus Pacebacteria bacterium CG_4_10_14_3_um_filter_34_15]
MQNIHQIYADFQTPKNLQQHMLRVASLAKIITKNWTGAEINKKAIIQTCLIHDIAKPLHFDLTKQAQFGMTEVEVKALADLQKRLITDYSPIEHEAVLKICLVVGCLTEAIRLVDNLEWENVSKFLESNDLESLIPIYCDMRISPYGIMSLADRINDLKLRYYGESELEELKRDGLKMEEVLQKNVGVDFNGIEVF